MSMFGGFVSTLRQFVVKTPQIQPVRFRYYAEKKPFVRRYGYEDNLARRGLLPHYGDERVVPFPLYKYVSIYCVIVSPSLNSQKRCHFNSFRYYFPGRRIHGMRNERCSVKMITLTF